MNDELILVDVDDKEVGYQDKASVHREGKLHRAFSVFLICNGKMLVQKRNKNKYHSGGKLANACCSHPRKGEALQEAVHRRMQEELGMDCEIEELFDFVYFSQYGEELFEYEYDHVFLGEYGGEISADPEEIESVEWIELGELKERLRKEPRDFATWFLIAAPKVIGIWEKRNKKYKERN